MKTLRLTLLSITIFTSIQLFAQTQKGQDINGEDFEEEFGYAISMPDPNTMAVSARGLSVSKQYVKVFRWNGLSWVLKGLKIFTNSFFGQFGYSISMPDSNTIAIGAPKSNGNGNRSGHVQVFKWNGASWIQKGVDILGENSGDESGCSVSMPDSNTVAIGAWRNDGNNGSINNSGHVRIYKWNGLAWIQKGVDIDGNSIFDWSGYSVNMPDSNTVGIGAPSDGPFTGSVQIYKWDGIAWSQKGLEIVGDSASDNFGYSVSMPDSNTIAIGVPYDDNNGLNSGSTSIYKWNGVSWVQKGIDINGENAIDWSGWSVSMPDSNTVGIGAPRNDGNGQNSGHARVYEWIGNSWTQIGVDINGKIGGNESGWAISMPNFATIAIGGPSTFGFRDTGLVTVYQFCNFVPDTINASVCIDYTSPSGRYNWTASGIYRDSIFNSPNCDNYYVINLSINTNADTLTTAVCDSFISPSGRYIWRTSGNYLDTIPNSFACDSVITFNLTVNTNDISVSNFGTSIASNAFGAAYQWLNCDSNYSTISGETGQFFVPTISGNYAVEISKNGCIDTSACENVTAVGLSENSLEQITIFPNPTNGNVIIYFGSNQLNAEIQIRSIDGKLVYEQRSKSKNQLKIDLSAYQKGIYFVTIRSQDSVRIVKMVKN